MRIIAGTLRGRRIDAPPGQTTRPMLDRVRQAVFDIIGAAYDRPGTLPAVAVLDMFAGSGALGMEALSRGAAFACFVEEDRKALRTLQGNLKTLGLEGRTQVLPASALDVRVPPAPPQALEPAEGPASPAGTYTIVFLDPPYPLSRDSAPAGPVGALLTNLPERVPLDPKAMIVLRTEVDVRYDEQPYGRLRAFDVREYGGMRVTFFGVDGG